mmetsp:Transcript_15884/g.11207  ORF Transcript_15884/g.11207 Transcript_15884/m.11207 type:complete len:280 (+) Transcript_15884:249-1088(+)
MANSLKIISTEKLEPKYLKMVISMKESGTLKPICVMVKASKFQKMVQSTKVSGLMTRHTAGVDLSTATVMYMTVSGKKISNTETVPTSTQTAPTTSETGQMTSRTEKERKHGQINLLMKAHMSWARKKVKVSSPGRMAAPSPAHSKPTTCTDMEFMFGLMQDNTTETGLITKWMATVCSRGPMDASTTEIIKMTRKTAKVLSSGLMVASTKAAGETTSKMVKVSTLAPMETSRKASGKQESAKKTNKKRLNEKNLKSLKVVSWIDYLTYQSCYQINFCL